MNKFVLTTFAIAITFFLGFFAATTQSVILDGSTGCNNDFDCNYPLEICRGGQCQPVCDGDGLCSFGEDANNCPSDCYCGDGLCRAIDGEDINTCYTDCGWCGDGTCTNPPESSATCLQDCPSSQVCGNGIIEGTEQCDGSNLNSSTCISLGFVGGGTLGCYPPGNINECQFDTSQCSGVPPCPSPTQGGQYAGCFTPGSQPTKSTSVGGYSCPGSQSCYQCNTGYTWDTATSNCVPSSNFCAYLPHNTFWQTTPLNYAQCCISGNQCVAGTDYSCWQNIPVVVY